MTLEWIHLSSICPSGNQRLFHPSAARVKTGGIVPVSQAFRFSQRWTIGGFTRARPPLSPPLFEKARVVEAFGGRRHLERNARGHGLRHR